LPSVSAAVALAGTGDHVTAAAIVAEAATRNMVDDHAAAFGEAAATGADLDDLAAGLVAGDHSLVAFGALAQVLMVDAADVGTADGGSLHAEEHLSVAGNRNGYVSQFHGAVAGQKRASHDLITPSRSHKSSQVWSFFHRNTCPLMRRQLRSMAAIR